MASKYLQHKVYSMFSQLVKLNICLTKRPIRFLRITVAGLKSTELVDQKRENESTIANREVISF